MATLLPAILTKYDSLAAGTFAGSTRPPIYHEEAPQTTGTGAQLRQPYVTVELRGEAAALTFESDDVEVTRVIFTGHTSGATASADLDAIISAVRFDGQNSDQNAGFDNGTLPALTDGVLLSILLDRTPVKRMDGGRDRDGYNTYRADMEYVVSVQRS